MLKVVMLSYWRSCLGLYQQLMARDDVKTWRFGMKSQKEEKNAKEIAL